MLKVMTFCLALVVAGVLAGASAHAGEGALLAYEDFAVKGNMEYSHAGFGWKEGWMEHHDGAGPYQISDANPLSYLNLSCPKTYSSSVPRGFDEAGRFLDIDKAFAAYKHPANGLIGKPGTTLWLSLLLRLDHDNGGGVALETTTAHSAWVGEEHTWRMGDVGKDAVKDGKRCWTLQVNGVNKLTDKPVVTGTAALLVAKMEFKEGGGTISLYVNPKKLGGEAPATPDATLPSTKDLSFKNFYWRGCQSSSATAIRVGESFAAVTPVDKNAPAAPTSPTKPK